MKQAEILFSEAIFNYIVTTTVTQINWTENVRDGKLAQTSICMKILISTAKHSSSPLCSALQSSYLWVIHFIRHRHNNKT